MSDLVERLRKAAPSSPLSCADLIRHAADRIEELEARVDARETQMEELIDEVEALEYELKESRGEA